MTYQSVICPYCGIENNFESLNCCIFRCGIYYDTGKQIDPHLSKLECDKLFSIRNKEDINRNDVVKIFGCGKPYRVISNEGKLIAIKCDYI